jgi:regulator of replication initiation timing
MSNEVVIDLNALDYRALREVVRSLSMRLTEYFVDNEDLKKELGLELEASERLAKEAANYRGKFLDMTAKLAEANARAAERAQQAQAARNYELESAQGVIRAALGDDGLAFLDALKSEDVAKTIWNMPWACRNKIAAIPANQKIERIKALRTMLPGTGLKFAKDVIDSLQW